MLHPDSNYRSSQVSMRNNMKLQLSEQRGDIVDVSVSTATFWQLRAINWQSVEIIVTNEQQLATTRPTHWIWLDTHTHTYSQAHTQTDTETDKHIHRHIQRQTSTYSHTCGRKDFGQMPFTPRFVQYMVTNVLRDQQYMFVDGWTGICIRCRCNQLLVSEVGSSQHHCLQKAFRNLFTDGASV